MTRKLGTRAVALMTALTMAAPVALMPLAASAYVFNDVRIEGAQRIEPGTILSYANIARGQDVSAGELNDALQRLQNSGLFESVEVVPQGNLLVIRVAEYPTINQISFEGNRRIKDDQLAQMVQSQPRRVYQPSLAIADASGIAQAYAAQGRLAARVDPRIIRRSDNRIDLVFEIREGNVTEIERISFTGNRAFSDRRLRQVLETKQAGLLRTFIRRDTFAPERIPLDEQLLTDYYRSRGYADFRVQGVAPELARERDAFYITFNIQEGPRYRFANVNTVSEIPGVDASAFAAQNRVSRGDVYNPAVIDNTIRRMETVAIQQGLNFVNIEPRVTRNPQNQTLDLTFALTRGQRVFVERIDIEGNTTTLDEVIRRQFTVVEGDPFNPREIRNAAERIRALGYFSDAQVDSRQGSSSEQVIVDVNVEEQPTGSLSFGASYGVASGVGFNASLNEANFLGRGQSVGLTISTASDEQQASFSFAEPYFLGRDLRFGFTTWYQVTDSLNSYYDTRSVGISPSIEFPISANGRLELRYRLAKDTLLNVDRGDAEADPPRLGSSPILLREEESGGLWSSSLGYSYKYDTRITGLDPLTGYKLNFSQDYAGLGGDIEMVTTTLLAGIESRAWREEVALRAEFEAGALHPLNDYTTRITDRFRGGSKIRGFEPNGIGPRDLEAGNQDALGGNYFWAARAEAQFPIGLPEEYGITGGLFADIGSIWGLEDRVGQDGVLVDDGMHVRAAIGASIFWTTPIGPLRFNFSKAVKKMDYDDEQNFDLTISTRF
ncbi:Beta-barrel assembly machine subunit BamA [Paracoccus alcaliphilus]|uniref:Outer membrane protein assembly factor BamA n=1 Tax=Paracoccus alcaliphilus TaxID=34002 RepID=A0A1H8IMJ4_9RHOB|nr:outer membrane protein assembly factor BamA [Paracoccus alcaliphilus]WCR17798.1 outer membrane protein assembly factor BamA [Paracoccus alcaliphilus]SEN69541.1 Beta-barrel assembly machine subunit BamA [Paracoccus alcaliphilus]